MARPRRKVQPTVNPSIPPQLSAWPNLYRNQDKAQSLMAVTGWEHFLLDLQSHRRVNLERLAQPIDEKTSDKIRGAIKTIDFILSLPDTIQNWKEQK